MRVLGDRKDFDVVFSGLDKNGALFRDVQGVIDKLKNDHCRGENQV